MQEKEEKMRESRKKIIKEYDRITIKRQNEKESDGSKNQKTKGKNERTLDRDIERE